MSRHCRVHPSIGPLVERYAGYPAGNISSPAGRQLCIFWDHGCAIHPVKPRLCRRWPFIESVVTDPLNWTIMAGFCPGMRIDIPLPRIRACIEKVLKSEEIFTKCVFYF
jgi:Fe-S-cluster containining protein